MVEEAGYWMAGVVFGLAGGFAPGPTTTLVVSQTLRFGVWDGVKVAIAPALTDGPIVVAAVLLVGTLARFDAFLGVVSLLGAGFLFFLAYESFRVRGVGVDAGDVEPRSVVKGFMANALNPHPYLFWLTVGGPELVGAWSVGWMSAVGFMVGMYACLIGAKVLVAVLVGRSRGFLQSRGYVWVNWGLGVLLGVFGVLFLRDGLGMVMEGLKD